jgi:hypothetical protein
MDQNVKTLSLVGALATICVSIVSVVAIIKDASWATAAMIVGIVCATITVIVPVSQSVSLRIKRKQQENITEVDVGIRSQDNTHNFQNVSQQNEQSLGNSRIDKGEAILKILSADMHRIASKYKTASKEKRCEIQEESVMRYSSLQTKFNMPQKVFELYIISCLEEQRTIPLIEFIERAFDDFVSRHPSYTQDVAIWMAKNVENG